MPEAILKYQLPEEQDEFDTARNGSKYQNILYELDQEVFRSIIKYDAVPDALYEKIAADLKEYHESLSLSKDILQTIVQVLAQHFRTEMWDRMREDNLDIF